VEEADTPKAPAFTTATAWRRALTGAGATMAMGSHPCTGKRAAFTETPARRTRKRAR
jgi:hypothetical protein